MNFKRCILFLADGARPDVLNEQLLKGNLPNLSRYFVEPGVNKTILTSFPSTTGPAYLPFLTGCFPGTCNVPGIRWFDREHYADCGFSLKSFRSYVGLETFLMNFDIKKEFKTAFEIFQKPASMFNMINRGIGPGHNKTRWSRIWYMYYAHLTDRWRFVDAASARKLREVVSGDFDFAFSVFPGIDEYSHLSSPFHPRTVGAYHEMDDQIGSCIKELKAKGTLDETLLVLVSDHGLSETKTHFDVGPFLEQKGIKTFYYTQIFKRNFEAAAMVSGNGMAHLYFRGEKGWKGRKTFEELSATSLILDELRLKPEIDLVAVSGDNSAIHMLTSRGHGVFRINGNRVDYFWNHEEPLGLFNNSEKKLEMTMDQTLSATAESPYPDVFMQLTQIFRSPRCGDIVLSARKGCDLRKKYEKPEHKSSHGSINPDHMKIPFLMNYRLPEFHRPIRSVDVFPTILGLMGKEVPIGIDGQALI